MNQLRIGDQWIHYDREATVAAYSQIRQGGADLCTCLGCRNFALLREKAYPDAFRELQNTLGIDAKKEGEAVHYGPKEDSKHLYGGWFYFVGKIIEAGEGSSTAEQHRRQWFSIFGRHLVRTSSCSLSKNVAAIEFMTQLPWALDEPYDKTGEGKATGSRKSDGDRPAGE